MPTLIESGFKDIAVEPWLGFFAPGRTPPEAIAKLGAAIGAALKGDEIAEAFSRAGTDLVFVGVCGGLTSRTARHAGRFTRQCNCITIRIDP